MLCSTTRFDMPRAWPAHLFCQQVTLGWVCDLFRNTVSGSHHKFHIGWNWKRLMRINENAHEATWLSMKKVGEERLESSSKGHSIAYSKEHPSRKSHCVAREFGPRGLQRSIIMASCSAVLVYRGQRWVSLEGGAGIHCPSFRAEWVFK